MGFLADPLSRGVRGFMLSTTGITVKGHDARVVSFQGLNAPPTVKEGMLSATITLDLTDKKSVILKAVSRQAATAFRDATAIAWRTHAKAQLDTYAPEIDDLMTVMARLADPSAYPSACKVQPFLTKAQQIGDGLLTRLNPAAIGAEQTEKLAPLAKFISDPSAMRAEAVARFVEAELARWQEFFDTVESMPLTPEQRLSIVVDEDATLVLAGAGSGKTSVITAKAAYLLKAGIRPAEQILLMAFAKDAAAEMSERIMARCGVPIAACTFHALAYDIIGEVEGTKPPLAPHATDDTAFLALIREILRDLVVASGEVARAIIAWFAHFLVPPKDDWTFQSKHDWYSQLERQDLRTLQGEQVKSFEELQIANWLYENGIAYEYEPDYEHAVSGQGKRAYTPDFRLTDSGVYVEHFGVRREKTEDGFRLTTAPYIDREDYLQGMEWKRELHGEHGTTLVETFSYEQSEGRLLESLEKKLAQHVTPNPRALETIYDRVVELGHVDSFSRVLGTFLRQFKSGGYKVNDCADKAEKLKMGDRAKAFFAIFGPVFREYQHRLDNRIDFEDMIIRAAEYVEAGRYRSPFRHILVDEFQDISQSRARLIKALKAQHPDARLFAVGDDWQSIYRFAGSDIHIMRHFGEEFGGQFGKETAVHRAVDLGRTFRSVDKIALAAREFVLRNPAQITKVVVPAGEAKAPAIRVVWTRREGGNDRLHEVLARLTNVPPPEGRKTKVLLLGRYRFVEPDTWQLRKRFPDLDLSFKTIHGSKGLEADHVVILNMDSGTIGFPSEIADDPLLSLVSPEAEPFEHAEERRVMYVALTRARKTVTILASETRPSAFVRELLDDPYYDLAPVDAADQQTATCGECGGRMVTATSKAGRLWFCCEHTRLCGNKLPGCANCGKGLPTLDTGGQTRTCPSCATPSPACSECKDGWLVPRKGRFGEFLSCVRYPDCSGRERKVQAAHHARKSRKPRKLR